MLPKRVIYYGKDEDLPIQVPLKAGPIDLIYEQGDLRYICCGEHEVLRRVYVAIRDRNWGTVAPVLSQVQIQTGDDTFHIEYQVENRHHEISFRWQGVIDGSKDGKIIFSMQGEVLTTFWRNRIGFCVLYPAELAGRSAAIEHGDGTREKANFPQDFVSDQPVKPFAALTTVSHEISPGLWTEVSFRGDIFEMEDQRNWTDASFKIFSTPLNLPYPVEVMAGTKISQVMTLQLRESQPGALSKIRSSKKAGSKTSTLTVARDQEPQPIPRLGLGMAQHEQALSKTECERIRACAIDHLRVDLHLSEPAYPSVLKQAVQEAQALGAGLQIALLASDDPEAEMRDLRQVIDDLHPPVGAWLCYPEKELFGGGSAVRPVVEAARIHLESYNPSISFYSGTNTDFIFMKRSLPPIELCDGISFAMCPQVHAFDNASLLETLQVQGASVLNARRLGQGKPVIVSPVTLKMRFNPYATGAIPALPAGELPPQVDPRQMSLFGAAWTLGSIRALMAANAASVTYFETTGWRGIMETEQGSGSPDLFRSFPGGVYPLYHILAAIGEFTGGHSIPIQVSHPLQSTALCLEKDGRRRLIVANFLPVEQIVQISHLAGEFYIRRLDENQVVDAMQFPERFRSRSSERVSAVNGEIHLGLLPYAVLFLDQDEGG